MEGRKKSLLIGRRSSNPALQSYMDREIEKFFRDVGWITKESEQQWSDLFCGHDAADLPYQEITRMFLGILSLRSNVRFILTHEVCDLVVDVLKKHVNTSSPGDDLLMPEDTDFIIQIGNVSAISAIQFPNEFETIRKSIQSTNTLAEAIRLRDKEKIASTKQELKRTLQIDKPYIHGSIRNKENAYVFESKFGPIQIGIPPETIKYSMAKGEAIPQVYVLPPKLFADSLNAAEIEFPIYFNFFIKKAFMNRDARIIIVGDPDQIKRIRITFSESIHGPKPDQIYIDEEIHPIAKARGYNIDLPKEMLQLSFRRPTGEVAPIEDYAIFIPWKDGEAVVRRTEGLLKIVNTRGLLQFYEDDAYTAALDTNQYPRVLPSKEPRNKSNWSFDPPTFGVTFLGTSHGFDPNPKNNTTGFILWINGSGILIDPPTTSTDYLKENGIKGMFINKVILTHCHSDHDSGLLVKILDGEKIDLYTTKTINASFQRKMNGITGVDLSEFYHFNPVTIGNQVNILGAKFEFDYAHHTIPTLRFKVTYGGRTLAYSSDTLYDPDVFTKIRELGVISKEREQSLRMFVFDADVIIHESGVPPVHTSIFNLNELPTHTKKRMLIVHCHAIPATVEKTLPDGKKIQVEVKDLKIPPCGLENTLVIQTSPEHEGYSQSSRKFKMISDSFFFKSVSPKIICDLFDAMEQHTVEEGKIMIEAGTRADAFYLLTSPWHVSTQMKPAPEKEISSTFSEEAIFLEKQRWQNITRTVLQASMLTPRANILKFHPENSGKLWKVTSCKK
eukprot:TRINITY_DN4868_c0_g1_i4.p1 TRINITY_DN4868_c0_g1~~TRINITY_DN4868_c0_g1_i4.p1  ORF type:complete len:786 (-),score=204.84 TRINITY_DN4868_c0_g1_i4:504-2861(-)